MYFYYATGVLATPEVPFRTFSLGNSLTNGIKSFPPMYFRSTSGTITPCPKASALYKEDVSMTDLFRLVVFDDTAHGSLGRAKCSIEHMDVTLDRIILLLDTASDFEGAGFYTTVKYRLLTKKEKDKR